MATETSPLIDIIRKAYYKRSVPGLMHTLSGVATPAYWGGATIGAAKDTAKAFGHQLGRAAQAISPLPLAGVDPLDPSEQSLGGRAGVLVDTVLLGLPTAVERRYKEALPQGTAANLEETVKAGASALFNTAVQDVVGGREAGELLSGESNGQPLTPEQAGKNTTFLFLKLAGLGRLTRGKAPVKEKLTALPEDLTRKIRSVGEIEAAGEAMEAVTQRVEAKAAAAKAAREASVSPANVANAPSTTGEIPQAQIRAARNLLPEEVRQRLTIKESGILAEDEFQTIIHEVTGTEIYREMTRRMAKQKPQVNEVISESIKAGALNPRTISNIADIYGISIEEMSQLVPTVFERTASYHARNQNVLSQVTDLHFQRTMAKAMAGDVEAMRQYRDLTAAHDASHALTSSGLAHTAVREIERTRLAAMLATPVNMMRNFWAQGATFGNDIFESTVAGTAELLVGKFKGEKRSLGSYYSDFTENIASAISRMTPAARQELTGILRAFPGADALLHGASAYEVASGIMPSFFGKFKPRNFTEGAEALRNTLTAMTRAQEFQYRRLFFRARLKSNLERIGIKDFNELMAEGRKPQLREDVRWAVGNAVAHGLKQTYSWRPEGAFATAILDIYKRCPIMTALLTPFPRFIANSWRYINERGPSVWFDLFSKDFRDALYAGAEGGFASRQAARMLGRATSGVMLLSGAYALRNSPLAGPKYYLFAEKNPDGSPVLDADGNPVMRDVRAFEPFKTYAFLGELLKNIKENVPLDADNPLNLNPNEWLDALTGLRRISEVPLFAFTDQLHSARSDDPRMLQKLIDAPLGSWTASFFVPFRPFLDIAGGIEQALGGEAPEAWQRDIEGQELTGPARANIPGLNRTLPPRIDPFTGRPEETRYNPVPGAPSPIARQFSGISFRGISSLEQIIQETPDLPIQQLLLGNQPDQHSSQLVAEEMGRILSARVGAGTMGDMLARTIRDQNLSPKGQKEVLTSIFETLRDVARTAAMARDPQAFATQALQKSIPAPAQRLAEPHVKDLTSPRR